MLNLSTRAQTREVMIAEIKTYLETLPDYERWKDFFEASTGRTMLDLMVGISELLLYKLEVRSLDSYLPTAISQSATYLLAQMVGYNPNRKHHAVGTARFTFRVPPPNSLSIMEGYAFDEEIPLVVSKNTIVPQSTSSIDVPIIQGEWVETIFSQANGNLIGQDWEVLRVEENNFQVDQMEVYVRKDGKLLKTVDRIETATSESVLVRTDYRGGLLLLFGDGFYGEKLESGSEVLVKYLRTLGRGGNVSAGYDLGPQIFGTFIADVVVQQSVQGGSDEDSLYKVKHLASRFFQTQGRAVTAYDYVAIVESFPGVISAKVKRIDDECCTICVSAIKQKVRDTDEDHEWSEDEITDLKLYLEDYKMLSTKIDFWQPEPVPIDLNVRIVVPLLFNTSEVLSDVRQFIIDNFCYKLGGNWYPTNALDAIADMSVHIKRVYFVDDDLSDGVSPYIDKTLLCYQYFEPGNITITSQVSE